GGPGPAAVRSDVESYCRTVFGPFLAQERKAASGLTSRPHSGKTSRKRWLEVSDQMIQEYGGFLATIENYPAATGEVRSLNERMVHSCRAAVEALNHSRDALRRNDGAATAKAAQEISLVDFESVGRDVYRLAKQHHVDI